MVDPLLTNMHFSDEQQVKITPADFQILEKDAQNRQMVMRELKKKLANLEAESFNLSFKMQQLTKKAAAKEIESERSLENTYQRLVATTNN